MTFNSDLFQNLFVGEHLIYLWKKRVAPVFNTFRGSSCSFIQILCLRDLVCECSWKS